MARPTMTVEMADLPLPAAFTTASALNAGLTRSLLKRLVRDGDLEQVSRGLYLQTQPANTTEMVDTDLIEIALRAPNATICLTSALARHGLTDEIPASIDVALPRRQWQPTTTARVTWHRFAEDSFMIERHKSVVIGAAATEPVTIGLYSAERCIIDAFRTCGTTGFDIAVEALRRWLRDSTHQPAQLLSLCRHWPRTESALRNALEILL